MALALKDRVKETTIVVGTGTATLLGSSIGFQPFSVVGNGNTTYYCISDQFGSNWEVGIGTYTASGNTLSRTTVLASSNAGALVVFTAGIKDVFVTYPSEKGVWYDASGNVLLTGTTTATNLDYTGTLTGSTGILNIGSGQVYKDASGNVGIGTTGPILNSVLSIAQRNSTGNGSNTLTLDHYYANNKYIQFSWYGTNIGSISQASGTFIVIDSPALAFQTGSIDRMIIDSSGNVGIGTSNPVAKVNINLTPTASLAAAAIVKVTDFAANSRCGFGGVASNSDGLYFGMGVDGAIPAGFGFFRESSGWNTALAFYTNNVTAGVNSTAAMQEKMRIDSSGNVGIGTSSPATLLTVAGAITITGAFALRGSYGAGAITTNFAAGDGALASNTTGSYNTASGLNALFSNTTGTQNTASGVQALQNNTTGSYNTASGLNALLYNTTGSGNSASGMNALFSNTTGTQNTASGLNALFSNTTGNDNTASGKSALYSNTTGNYNTASGLNALFSNTTGTNNTASGLNALFSNTTGSGNSAFNPMNSAGTYAPVFNPTTENDRFCMGSTGVTNAYIQVAWTVVSDARDKTSFAPVPHGLDFVNQLQPTTYQFKEDRETDVATGIVRYGFKAQDILALEGDTPVIIDTEDLDKLRFNSDSLIPVLVNAIKELTTRLKLLEGK